MKTYVALFGMSQLIKTQTVIRKFFGIRSKWFEEDIFLPEGAWMAEWCKLTVQMYTVDCHLYGVSSRLTLYHTKQVV